MLPLFLLLVAPTAHAADANYCRPYARDYVEQLQKYEWDRAYTHCLNSDEPPVLPQTWEDAMKILDLAAPPLPLDLSKLGTVPAVDKTKPAVGGSTKLSPAAFCATAKRKIIYNGKSWKCQ